MLKRREITASAFARQVQMSQPTISRVMSGSRPPPVKDDDRWCEVLGLTGQEAERFKDAMHIAAASPRVRRVLDRMEAQLRARRSR